LRPAGLVFDVSGVTAIRKIIGAVARFSFLPYEEPHGTVWEGASDIAAATTLLHSVNADTESLPIGVRTAQELIASHP
jgi:hypothetical protein